jgi:hypothetical protein
VSYYANGADSGTLPASSVSHAYGDTVTVLSNTNNLARTAYNFGGWRRSDTGSVVNGGDTFTMGESDVTLSAEWIAVPVQSITLNRTKAGFAGASRSVQLSSAVSPADASDKRVTWTTSDPSVATVDSTGKVTSVAQGTADIKAVSVYDSSKYAVCRVTVKTGGSIGTLSITGLSTTGTSISPSWKFTDDGVAEKIIASGCSPTSEGVSLSSKNLTVSDTSCLNSISKCNGIRT